MARRGSSLLLVVAVITLAITASARAGTVGRLNNPDEGYAAIWFNAGAGERNDVTVHVAAKSIAIADSGAPIKVEAGSGCTAVDAHSARCPRGPHLTVDLGDKADRARLVYSAPARGDFADINGGAGNDTLIGGSQAESFDSGPGADVIDAGAGDDDLTGGEGPDVLRGGPGNDTLNVHDYNGAPSDDVDCGRGNDGLNYDVDPADVVHRDCEGVGSISGVLPLAPSFGSGVTGTYRVPCKRIGNGRPTHCTVHVVLLDRAGRLLAEGRGSLRTAPYRAIRERTSHLSVGVRLTTLGQRALRSGKSLVIAERVAYYDRIPGFETARENLRYRVAWP